MRCFYKRSLPGYRNRLDKDLDPAIDAVPQRRYGDPNITSGINKLYRKPCLTRNHLPISYGLGNHGIIRASSPLKYSEEHLLGAHWVNADPVYVFERRLKNRKERFGKRNLEKKWSIQHIRATEESIR